MSKRLRAEAYASIIDGIMLALERGRAEGRDEYSLRRTAAGYAAKAVLGYHVDIDFWEGDKTA